MFEVIYYDNGKQTTKEFPKGTKEKEAIKFAMKFKGILFKDTEIIENFSD